jgi:hypothetical protein
MVEQKSLSHTEIANKVKEVIDGVLATGDWEHSLFLKTSAAKLRQLRVDAEKLSNTEVQSQNEITDKAVSVDADSKRRVVPAGYSQVFILLYQVDDTNLQSWYRTIETLIEHSVARPAYKEEAHAEEFIRSKASGIERNGYAIVNIKSDDFYEEEVPPVDAYGHQLFVLKENAIQMENVVEFVHANKSHYALRDSGLVLLDADDEKDGG